MRQKGLNGSLQLVGYSTTLFGVLLFLTVPLHILPFSFAYLGFPLLGIVVGFALGAFTAQRYGRVRLTLLKLAVIALFVFVIAYGIPTLLVVGMFNSSQTLVFPTLPTPTPHR